MNTVVLPEHDEVVARVGAVEQEEGWLAACEHHGDYLVLTRPLVESLAQFLKQLGNGRVLEVGGGSGVLAEALDACGVKMIATDPGAAVGSMVQRMDGRTALRRFQPRVVLGSFVPFDSKVDEAVLGCSSVTHYLVLNARLGGAMGSEFMWRSRGWTATPLQEISRWMITRHDVWMGKGRSLLRHGEAWHMENVKGKKLGDIRS